MKVKYALSVGGYGGVQQAFSSPHNWKNYAQFDFRFYGTNTGHTIRLELMDNRAPGSTTDTSERFEYLFKDNFTGWRSMSLPWAKFTRRTSWQPAGAPNNGLTLTQVWGYSFAPLNGSGSFEIDQVLLRTAALAGAAPLDAGTSLPGLTQPALTSTEPPSPTPVPASASLVLADFELTGAAISLFRDANSSISAQAVSPGQAGGSALQVDASVAPGGWAGVQMLYSAPADWSVYKNFDFWFHGNNTGNPMRLEIFDNRQAGSTADTSERFEYRFTDDTSGWKHFTLPWSSFSRRSDWQPDGAPNDGLSLSQVWGFQRLGGQRIGPLPARRGQTHCAVSCQAESLHPLRSAQIALNHSSETTHPGRLLPFKDRIFVRMKNDAWHYSRLY